MQMLFCANIVSTLKRFLCFAIIATKVFNVVSGTSCEQYMVSLFKPLDEIRLLTHNRTS